MAFLFILFIAFVFISVIAGANAPKPVGSDPFVVDVPKNCPPHKWRYHEVKDTEGNTVKWKLACDICGPLKPIDGPARLE